MPIKVKKKIKNEQIVSRPELGSVQAYNLMNIRIIEGKSTINLEESYILLSGTSKLVLILKANVKLAFSLPSLTNEEFGLQLVLALFCVLDDQIHSHTL